MRLRAQRTYLFLLILCFLFVDVSESISFAPAVGLLNGGGPIPSFIRQIIANKGIFRIWNNLKSLFKSKRIGEIAKGLNDVKDYLEIFGYLNSTLHPKFTDEFTKDLQSAIIEFQKNFNLQVTGQLDQNMYHIMSQPRCGVPDIINDTTTMNSSSEVNTTTFEPWWRTGETELTYAFYPKNNVTDGVKTLFQDAFNKWSKVTSLNFTETTSFSASDIKIAFVMLDGKGGTVGGAVRNYRMHVGGIYLDSEEQWVLPSKNLTEEGDDVDLESVVMHQIGHVLGLGHSSVEKAVMYPIVLPEKKTELANDDLQRIQQIYGVNSNNNSSSPTHERVSTSGDAGCGWRRNVVLSLAVGFAFVVLGFV